MCTEFFPQKIKAIWLRLPCKGTDHRHHAVRKKLDAITSCVLFIGKELCTFHWKPHALIPRFLPLPLKDAILIYVYEAGILKHIFTKASVTLDKNAQNNFSTPFQIWISNKDVNSHWITFNILHVTFDMGFKELMMPKLKMSKRRL